MKRLTLAMTGFGALGGALAGRIHGRYRKARGEKEPDYNVIKGSVGGALIGAGLGLGAALGIGSLRRHAHLRWLRRRHAMAVAKRKAEQVQRKMWLDRVNAPWPIYNQAAAPLSIRNVETAVGPMHGKVRSVHAVSPSVGMFIRSAKSPVVVLREPKRYYYPALRLIKRLKSDVRLELKQLQKKKLEKLPTQWGDDRAKTVLLRELGHLEDHAKIFGLSPKDFRLLKEFARYPRQLKFWAEDIDAVVPRVVDAPKHVIRMIAKEEGAESPYVKGLKRMLKMWYDERRLMRPSELTWGFPL